VRNEAASSRMFKQGANEARTAAAAARDVERARAALAAGVELGDELRAALEARVAHPAASVRELGAALGLTKDAFARRLRRGLHLAEEAAGGA
jgi:DNA-binding transcriptional regulator WhiA